MEKTGRVPVRLLVGVAVVVVAVSVAVLKPWGMAGPDRAYAGGFDVGFPAPTDSPEKAARNEVLSRALCGRPQYWRLVTMETSALGNTRTMYGIVPATATGPTDRSIPTANLHADRLIGIGVCSPAQANPSLLSPVTGVTVWSVPPAGELRRFDDMPVLDEALNELGEAYFGPPRTETDPFLAGSTIPTWPPGRYVIQIDRADTAGVTLWIALDFTLPIRPAEPQRPL